MKHWIIAALCVFSLAGCSSEYIISTTDGQMLTSDGKPQLDEDTGMIEFTDSEGAAESRQALTFWREQWQGRSLMAIGQQDPVLGEPVMRALREDIRGCPEPLLLPQAGHFVQEHGAPGSPA